MSSLDKNSVDRGVEHFLRRIILTKGQNGRATSAINSIKSSVSSSELCPSDASIFVQGSFATRTTLKPDIKRALTAEFDVDIAVESRLWEENDPESALKTVFRILSDSGVPTNRLKVKTSCVRIIYADGAAGEKFHVDVVPILNYGTAKYAVKCKDGENIWIESDPGKLMRWFSNKAHSQPTFRAQYLLMKRFAQMNGIKIPSIAIQKITADAYSFKDSRSRYLRELLDMCRIAIYNLNDPSYLLTNPVNDNEDIRDRLKDGELDRYKNLLIAVVKRIENFSLNGTYTDVVELFGDKFPKKESHEKELSLRANGIYFDCEFADPLSLTAIAENGEVVNSNYYLTVPSDHENRENRTAVDRIKFTINEIPNNHSTKWQVINDPHEVPFQIRGNLEDPNIKPTHANTEHRSETVSYAGKHFVRVFIIKGNRYTAVSDRFNVNVSRASV